MKKIFLALVLSCFLIPSAFAGFVDQLDGTVWDDDTGLMWQKGHASTAGDHNNSFKWGGGTELTSACDGTADPDGESGAEQDALCYCDNLGLGSYTDWRLADRNEMHSTLDYANSPALADPFVTDAADHWFFWTSTSNNNDPTRAWAVGQIVEGKLSQANRKTNTNHVRCVRGRVFQVAVSKGANLEVSDADLGDNWVDYGADQDVTYTAAGGFSINDVEVDGTSIGPQTSPYTHSFINVVGNHEIHATTATATYDFEVTVGDNGTVKDVNNDVTINPPGGTVTVDHGLTQTFEVTPATHFHINQVQYDSVDVTLDGNNQYTTPAITEVGHTFSASFAEDDKFALTVTTDGFGSGTVTSDDSIIDCPDNTCSHEYYFDHPVPIVLTADEAADSVFAGWTGDCSSTLDRTCTLNDMSQARNVTATFDSTEKKMTLMQIIQGVLGSLSAK